MYKMKSMKSIFRFAAKATLVLAALLSLSSCRRKLWVYQDYFKNILVLVDWRSYDRDKQLYPHTPDPQGMTVYFYPTDGRSSYRFTTTEVHRYPVYMSQGDYGVLVFDYSPEEYNMQEFLGMDYANTAKVQATADPYQGVASTNALEDETPLYNEEAYAHELMSKQPTGLWTVSNIPENIASDVEDITVTSGVYTNYIPYEERNTYQETLTQQELEMTPLLIPWHMRVRIPIKGIYYLRSVSGSIAGLADGYYLMKEQTSDDPCIHTLKEDWQIYVTGDNEGYIAFTFDTWGMRNKLWSQYELQGPPFRIEAAKDEVRINLRVLLRDRKTVCYFHIDCGDQVWVFGNEYALSVDMRDVLEGDDIPELPYVDAVNGIEFDGIVVPWEPLEEIDVDF